VSRLDAMTLARLRDAARSLEALGLLEPADLAIVGELARLGGERRADVLVALALAVAAPRRGDVALDLGALRALGEPGAPVFEAPEALLGALSGSALVGSPEAPPRPFVLHRGLLYARRYFVHQRRLAEALRALAAELAPVERSARAPRPLPAEAAAGSTEAVEALLARLFPEQGEGASDRQRLAVALALRKRLTVLSGGPGTGKTFTIRIILAALLELGARPRIALSAPTGKAAARITEAIAEGLDALPVTAAVRAEIAALRGQTIHRLLGVDPSSPARFRHGPRRPLPYDVVLVDEASMVDLPLLAKLVAALRPGARLVLLGDRHQLASVQAGSVLADLTATRVPFQPRFSPALAAELASLGSEVVGDEAVTAVEDCVVHLDRPRRFAAQGGVGRLAAALADGSGEAIERSLALLEGEAPGAELRLVPYASGRLDRAALARLAAGHRAYLACLDAGPRAGEAWTAFHRRVLDAFDAYRVLCVHRVGPFGVEALDHALARHLLRARRSSADPASFWLGRPVLVRRNSYDVGRMNGDVGVVVRGEGGAKLVAFADDATSGVAYLPPERLPPHEGALAMTVHKSQGSQFDRVALLLPQSQSPLLTREVVYTAVTRARRGVEVFGDREVLRAALAKTVARASGLRAMLFSPTEGEGTP
jgi:exodeoxyribonuclease V alpha subunit